MATGSDNMSHGSFTVFSSMSESGEINGLFYPTALFSIQFLFYNALNNIASLATAFEESWGRGIDKRGGGL